mmetsp:Transcript_96403/g.267939  ORF Transcript_96403/g.267939 Transcript_96403/m.267939 type:complete len:373 (-) Transcript_96403:2550-3668(-)
MKASSRSRSDWCLSISWVRTRARTTAGLNGLVMKSAAPASSPRVSSSGWSWAVTKTTVIARSSGSAFSSAQSSWPSMPGICTSSSTRSGWRSRQSCSARAPLVAISTWQSLANTRCRAWMLAGWSSTSSRRGRRPGMDWLPSAVGIMRPPPACQAARGRAARRGRSRGRPWPGPGRRPAAVAGRGEARRGSPGPPGRRRPADRSGAATAPPGCRVALAAPRPLRMGRATPHAGPPARRGGRSAWRPGGPVRPGRRGGAPGSGAASPGRALWRARPRQQVLRGPGHRASRPGRENHAGCAPRRYHPRPGPGRAGGPARAARPACVRTVRRGRTCAPGPQPARCRRGPRRRAPPPAAPAAWAAVRRPGARHSGA